MDFFFNLHKIKISLHLETGLIEKRHYITRSLGVYGHTTTPMYRGQTAPDISFSNADKIREVIVLLWPRVGTVGEITAIPVAIVEFWIDFLHPTTSLRHLYAGQTGNRLSN